MLSIMERNYSSITDFPVLFIRVVLYRVSVPVKSGLVCYTAVLSVVTQRTTPQSLRDDTKKSGVAD